MNWRRGIMVLPDGREIPVSYCEIDESGALNLKQNMRRVLAGKGRKP